MRSPNNISKNTLLVFIIVTFLLQLSFNYNFSHAAGSNFFKNHQKDSESLVIGKLVDSKNNGIFNKQALGRYSEKIVENYDFYLNDTTPSIKIGPYNSSFGFQGYLYSTIDKILSFFDLSPKTKLNIMYFLTSLAMSLIFSVFIILVKKEFGIFPTIVLFIGIISSRWLIVFARNLYWMTFLLFLPFVYIWYMLKKEENNTSEKLPKCFYTIIFLIIYIKSLAGFEYLSTIFISLATPFIYFYFKNDWKFKKLAKRLFFLYCSAFIAFFISIFTFLLQKYFITGDFSKALEILKTIILKRTHGDPDQVNPIYKASLESNINEVILKYLDGIAFNLRFTTITFGEIICVFGIFICIFLLLKFTNKLKMIYDKEQKSLLFTTIIASLAPLSWYILAKGHSYVHTHMNHILWYLPFLLLVFIFIGLTLSYLKFKQRLLVFLIIISLFFVCSNHKRNNNLAAVSAPNIIILTNMKHDLNILFEPKNQKNTNMDLYWDKILNTKSPFYSEKRLCQTSINLMSDMKFEPLQNIQNINRINKN